MELLQYGSKGQRVKQLQRLLNDNPYLKLRRKLVVDGDMGTLTCAAVQRAKRRIGYAEDDIKPVAGETLFEYLSGKRKPSPEYVARHKARLAKIEAAKKKQSAETKMRLEALRIIKGELGTIEKPSGSNHIKYNDYWGWGRVPYCMIFIAWAWIKAGSKAFIRGRRWAGCREMLADAKEGGYGIHLTNDPDPGCPGVANLYGDARPDHAITFVEDNGDGTAKTWEANTTKDGTSIQGVFVKRRLLRDCWWFEVEK